MKTVLTARQMRESEKRYFDKGNRSADLMENAAAELVRTIISVMPSDARTCAFACGTGGNGGDGYAAARIFARKGGRAVVVEMGEPSNEDARQNRKLTENRVYARINVNDLDKLPKPDVWADCVFGTGLSRAPEGAAAKLIERMNRDKADGSKIVSCDVPSGLNADSGETPGVCVNADVTVALGAYKPGQLLGCGPDFCGQLLLKDIGIPDEIYPDEAIRYVEDEDAVKALPVRNRACYKNQFGHLLIVAGSRGMAGAAVITAKAALRSGCGLVTIACPESILDILQIGVPCAMCEPMPEKDGAISDAALPKLKKCLEGKTAVAAGPGLSRMVNPKVLKLIMESGIKTVLDADALNVIAAHTELYGLFHPNLALTPHPGEASRLTGLKNAGQMEYAESLSSVGWKVLIKGACSVIMGTCTYISASGCPGMAKGGSGDALTGIVGSLLAQGLDTETALWAGSQIHGRAGEYAQKKHGVYSMLPTDLIEELGEVMKLENA